MLVFWQLPNDDRPAKEGSAGLAARLPVPSSSSDRRALSHSLTSADELRRHGFLFCVREVLQYTKQNVSQLNLLAVATDNNSEQQS